MQIDPKKSIEKNAARRYNENKIETKGKSGEKRKAEKISREER
jgi:hypothetical protein